MVETLVVICCPSGEALVVAAAHHDGVQREALETARLSRVQSAQHLGQVADAGDRPETVGAQRVQADIDAFDAGRAQGRCKAIEL